MSEAGKDVAEEAIAALLCFLDLRSYFLWLDIHLIRHGLPAIALLLFRLAVSGMFLVLLLSLFRLSFLVMGAGVILMVLIILFLIRRIVLSALILVMVRISLLLRRVLIRLLGGRLVFRILFLF